MVTNSRLLFLGMLIVGSGYAAACGDGEGSGSPTGSSSSSSSGSSSSSSSGSSSSSSGGGQGGAGGAPECASAAQCPVPQEDCKVASCVNGVCGSANAPDGTPVDPQTDGDCKINQCQGGVPMVANDDADPPDDGKDCTIDSCKAGAPLFTNAPDGDPCAQSGKVCSAGACVACLAKGDCAVAEICVANACVPDPCVDGVKNGDETDLDCGGSCSVKCGPGKACLMSADCVGGSCQANVCEPTCTDNVQNGMETDVDCGGACATKCGPDKSCKANGDCLGGMCDPGTLKCLSTCSDGVKGGTETDVDCGGGACAACPVGSACVAPSDCTSTACDGGKCALLNGCDPATAMDLTGQDPVTITFGAFFYDTPCIRVAPGTKVIFSGAFASHPLAGGTIVGAVKTPDPASPFMPITNSGMSKTFTLANPGAYPYYCDFHSQMVGAVFVQ